MTYDRARGKVEDTEKIKEYKPLSKKGAQAWNFITQPNAKMISENMYKNGNDETSKTVGSYLVDSQAWNHICHVFDKILGTSENGRTITDSTKLGNYYNNTTTDYTKVKGLWAKHGGTVTGVKVATKYESTILTEEDRKDGSTGNTYIELPTGASDDFRIYNIYDMAGNVWELTTEHNISKDNMYAVIRGGGFAGPGETRPVVRAHAQLTLTNNQQDSSFRVVLYIK